MDADNRKCDVCINIYGKFYQTLVTLKTLLLYNRKYINKIYLVLEKRQPEKLYVDRLISELGYDNIEIFIPKYYFGLEKKISVKLTRKGLEIKKAKVFTNKYNTKKLYSNREYRYSVRYQYALEQSKCKYLFIMHNDVVFHNGFLDLMMDMVDDGYLGVGSIGQCWNCPLSMARVCSGDIAQDLKLSYEEVCFYVDNYKSPRTKIKDIDSINPLPMPECRLNEWVSMVNCEVYKNITIPCGKITPLGKMGLDIGTEFYKEAILSGYKFKNIGIDSFSTHGFFSSQGCGDNAMFDGELYLDEEKAAKYYLSCLPSAVETGN